MFGLYVKKIFSNFIVDYLFLSTKCYNIGGGGWFGQGTLSPKMASDIHIWNI